VRWWRRSVTDPALLAANTQVVGAHTNVGCGLGFAQATGGGDNACLHDRRHSISARHGARVVVLTGVCNVSNSAELGPLGHGDLPLPNSSPSKGGLQEPGEGQSSRLGATGLLERA
jgi:hypothetical protein